MLVISTLPTAVRYTHPAGDTPFPEEHVTIAPGENRVALDVFKRLLRNSAFQKHGGGGFLEVRQELDADELCLDGPTLAEWIDRGYAAAGYPPERFAPRWTPEEQAEVEAARAARDAERVEAKAKADAIESAAAAGASSALVNPWLQREGEKKKDFTARVTALADFVKSWSPLSEAERAVLLPSLSEDERAATVTPQPGA